MSDGEDGYDAQLKTLEELAKKIQADCRARDVEIGQLAALGERLAARLNHVEEVCLQAYQAVGELARMAGVRDTQSTAKLLDNLRGASQGTAIPHTTILPFAPERVPCGECHLPAGERCDICGALDRNGAAG